jgi:hypothetical protein
MSAVAAPAVGTRRNPAGRSLTSYLLLPRPKDAVKWWLLPIGYAVGALATGAAGGGSLARAIAVWAILELLVYQARYQWNDIRGFAADQRHPDAAARGRLPGPIERGPAHIRASRIVIGARIVLALGLGLLTGVAAGAAFLIAAVFGLAAVYEYTRARATGRSSEVPPPLRGAILALWVVVGGGYAIRGLAGLALVVSLPRHAAAAAAALIALWAYGVMFVTARWALEALAFARVAGDGLRWRADHRQAREHTLALARWLPEAAPQRLESWAPLRAARALTAPWNLALICAGAAAIAAGTLLAGTSSPLAVALLAGAAAASALLVGRAPRREATALCATALLLALELVVGGPRPAAALLPWALVAAAYLRFTAQRPAALGVALRAEEPAE